MMPCRELAQLLGDFVSNELLPEDRNRVEDHLHQCALCAALHHSYAFVIQLTRSLPASPLSPAVARRLAAVLSVHQG